MLDDINEQLGFLVIFFFFSYFQVQREITKKKKKTSNTGILSRSYDSIPCAVYMIAFQVESRLGLKCFHEIRTLENSLFGQEVFISAL